MSDFNPGNFYCGTAADWTGCARPDRRPDHSSPSGSDYWYSDSGVVRYSDHWGSEVASCDWYLDGAEGSSFDDDGGWRSGYATWDAFALKPYEVTVYHPMLLSDDSLARLGEQVREGTTSYGDVPYASYRVRPDMIVDGCVRVAGGEDGCLTPFDGRCLMCVDVADWTDSERAGWDPSPFPDMTDGFGIAADADSTDGLHLGR